MFLMGRHPKPSCEFKEQIDSGEILDCDKIADWHNVPLCHDHKCTHRECENQIVQSGYRLCTEHVCCYDGCVEPRIQRDNAEPKSESFCEDHACFQCILLGIAPAAEALDEAPRNVCENHQLCSVLGCQELAVKEGDYCEQHGSTKCKFKGCHEWAIARGLPYCQGHEREMEWLNATSELFPKSGLIRDAPSTDRTSRRQCKGKNKKKKPCKSTAMSGSDFCEAHSPKDGFGFKAMQTTREKELVRPDEVEDDTDIPKQNKNMTGTDVDKIDNDEELLDDDEEEYGPPPDLDVVDLEWHDDADEMNEGDGMQHIREIFDVESGEESNDEFEDCIESEGDQFHECHSRSEDIGTSLKDPRDWSWALSLDDRWAACQAFLNDQYDQLLQVQELVKHELPLARKRAHEAESRAKARVFENKTVIGGTIVGCIARLDLIRATRPFAVSNHRGYKC